MASMSTNLDIDFLGRVTTDWARAVSGPAPACALLKPATVSGRPDRPDLLLPYRRGGARARASDLVGRDSAPSSDRAYVRSRSDSICGLLAPRERRRRRPAQLSAP